MCALQLLGSHDVIQLGHAIVFLVGLSQLSTEDVHVIIQL